jgi:phage anti-repressor protein
MSQLNFSLTTASILLDSSEQFPVDFDWAWQWLGYGKKSDAKEALLNKGFVVGVDLRIDPQLGTLDNPRPTERITLTVDCFKTWGMMAGTEQGKQVRKYFLECERIAKGKITTLDLLQEIDLQGNLIRQQNQQINLLQSELQSTIKIVNNNAKILTEVKAFGHSTSCLVDRLLDRNVELQSDLDRLNHPYGKYYAVLGWLNNRAQGLNDIKQLAPSEVARIGKRCAAECEKRRITIEQVYDMRYGTIGAYPETIISNCIPHEFYL